MAPDLLSSRFVLSAGRPKMPTMYGAWWWQQKVKVKVNVIPFISPSIYLRHCHRAISPSH
jgi:hypothetical protein